MATDIQEGMAEAIESHIKAINSLIDKALKRYCEIRRVDFESVKKNKSLIREIHPNYESFLYDGIEIFRMVKTKKDFNNEGCSGIEVLYSITEFF